MWKNRHVVIAVLVAPMLAIMAWFAVDYFVAEKAQPARAGASYPLIAKSNCRYNSGRCDLANGDFEVALMPATADDDGRLLALKSRFELEMASAGFVDSDGREDVRRMVADGPAKTQWNVAMPTRANEGRLRIAVVAQGATYFAEVPLVFVDESGGD